MSNLFVLFVFLFIKCAICSTTQCGKPQILPAEDRHRIMGGVEARRGSLPWMAMLTELGNQVCGGSIINDRMILTAAHCFEDPISMVPARWKVILGKHDVRKLDVTEVSYSVEQIIMHEGYDPNTVANDIAILVLTTRIQFDSVISPICLPQPNLLALITSHQIPFQQVRGIAAGWGETRGTSPPDVLTQVTLNILNDRTCGRFDWYGADFIPKTTFCAGYNEGGRDSCLGDSGGPFVVKYGNTWYQIGITSWGYDCGQPKRPGIYTDVSKYLAWIDSKSRQHGIYLS